VTGAEVSKRGAGGYKGRRLNTVHSHRPEVMLQRLSYKVADMAAKYPTLYQSPSQTRFFPSHSFQFLPTSLRWYAFLRWITYVSNSL